MWKNIYMLKYEKLSEIGKQNYRNRLLKFETFCILANNICLFFFFCWFPFSFIGLMLLAQYEHLFDDYVIIISQVIFSLGFLSFPLTILSFFIERAYVLPKKDSLYEFCFKKIIKTDIFSKEF